MLKLIKHEINLEFKRKYALNSILLYLVSTVFICYISFRLKTGTMQPITWNALFWLVMLFNAINATSKAFILERESRLMYYYFIVRAEKLILGKIIYNTILTFLLASVAILLFIVTLGNPIQDLVIFFTVTFLASAAFASALTLNSMIAAKAGNNFTLMAVLSFPIVIPALLMAIKGSKVAIDGLGWDACTDELMTLTGINIITWAVAVVLFPYLWRN
ncbi:MAG: heme exporter protein CcmB [Candidatus Cyclobacteriaceae bacterium M2_1C_046]